MLSDAAVARGSFTLSGVYDGIPGFPIPFAGNTGDFTSISAQGEQVRPDYLRARLNTTLTFYGAGDVSSSYLAYYGVNDEALISGTGVLASGRVGSDSGSCSSDVSNLTKTCFVSGFWTHTAVAIPEPAGMALYGLGLLGLAVVRRRVAAEHLLECPERNGFVNMRQSALVAGALLRSRTYIDSLLNAGQGQGVVNRLTSYSAPAAGIVSIC